MMMYLMLLDVGIVVTVWSMVCIEAYSGGGRGIVNICLAVGEVAYSGLEYFTKGTRRG